MFKYKIFKYKIEVSIAHVDHKISKRAIVLKQRQILESISHRTGFIIPIEDVSSKVIDENETKLCIRYRYSHSMPLMRFKAKEPIALQSALDVYNKYNSTIDAELDSIMPVLVLKNIIYEYAKRPDIEIVD